MRTPQEIQKAIMETKERFEECKKHCNDTTDTIMAFQFKLGILNDNYKRSIFAEVAPVLVEVWNRYEGKQCGPKTEDKICEEIEQRTGHRLWISRSRYIDLARFTIAHDLSVEWQPNDICTNPLPNNTVTPIKEDELYLYDCGEYVEDVDNAVIDLLNKYGDVQRAFDDFQRKVRTFNNSIPSNVHRLDATRYRNYLEYR